MKKKLANEYFDVELGLQGQADWHSEHIEDIALLDSKQATEHFPPPYVTIEMQARADKLFWWKFKVRLIVGPLLIFLKGMIRILAIKLSDPELAQAIRDFKLDRIAAPHIADMIVDMLAHTGLRVFGFTILAKQLPDDVEAVRELLGDEAARECWPVQRELALSWWNRFRDTGEFDPQGLHGLPWFQKMEVAYAEWVVLQAAAPYVNQLCDEWFPREADSKDNDEAEESVRETDSEKVI